MNEREKLLDTLIEKAKSCSESPGIYRMLDQNGKIIYVGKAKNLRNRVKSYFQKNIEDLKTKTLVSKIVNFEVVLTKSEAEALVLESILIKKYKPKYNILLKDDKSYPYVTIQASHTFPKLSYTRKPKKKDKQLVFGPYASAYSLRQAIRTLNKSFQLRDCSDTEFLNRSRPCINHQIGICSAPCTALITPDEYQKTLNMALEVLKGKTKTVISKLQKEMDAFSNELEYEQAAKVRDQIAFLEEALKKKSRADLIERGHKDLSNRDIIGWHRKPEAANIVIMLSRGGDLVDSQSFYIEGIDNQSDDEVLLNFLSQIYLTEDLIEQVDNTEEKSYVLGLEKKEFPEEIILPFDFEDIPLFEESLASLGCNAKLIPPIKGIKADLLELANKNAENAFDEKQREKGSIYKVLSDLKAKLRLENYPRRIECFDISNLGDTNIVASRVTFIEGKPDKSLYRRYRIKSIDSQNDFASMKEVLTRRLNKVLEENEKYEEPPDLLIVDGGKGQLGMAAEVIKELNITGLDLVALAKAKTIDTNEEKNSERQFERIFKPGRMNPIVLAPESPICHLLERIRNEAHRFAIEFQRSSRNNY